MKALSIEIMNKSLMLSVCNPAFWVQLAVASLASAQTVDQLIPHQAKLESVELAAGGSC